jgi:hypothetical protein
MLEAEEQVVEDSNEGQDDLGDVETVLDRQPSAGHGEHSSKKVEENIEDGPSFGALPFIIPISGRGVLDKRDDQFAIPQNGDGIPILVILYRTRLPNQNLTK